LLEKHGDTDGISPISYQVRTIDENGQTRKKTVFEELKMLRTERHQENECRMCNDKLRMGKAQYLLKNGQKSECQ